MSKSSSQKGSAILGIIILVFIIMIAVLIAIAALGYIKSKFEGPCNWLRAVDSMFSSNFSNNIVCNAIGAGGESGGAGASGNYTPAVQWICSGPAPDLTTLGDPTTALDGGATPPTVIYQYSDKSYVGYVNGSIAWRGNNPGNISSDTPDKNKIGNNGRFAAFKNPTLGYNAIISLLEGKVYSNLSITDALSKYAPPIENDTTTYINNVVKAINDSSVTANTKLSDLSSGNITKLADAIKVQEGWKVGQILGGCIAIAPATKSGVRKDYKGTIPVYNSTVELNFDTGFGDALLAAIKEGEQQNPPIKIMVFSGSSSTNTGHAENSRHYNGLAVDIYVANPLCNKSTTDGCDKEVVQIMNHNNLVNPFCFDGGGGFAKGDCNHFQFK